MSGAHAAAAAAGGVRPPDPQVTERLLPLAMFNLRPLSFVTNRRVFAHPSRNAIDVSSDDVDEQQYMEEQGDEEEEPPAAAAAMAPPSMPFDIDADLERDRLKESALGRIDRKQLADPQSCSRMACFSCSSFDPKRSVFIDCTGGCVMCTRCVKQHCNAARRPTSEVRCACGEHKKVRATEPPNPLVERVVAPMVIKCALCPATYAIGRDGLGDDAHLRSDCPAAPVPCTNMCGETVARGDMEAHLEGPCLNARSTCIVCNLELRGQVETEAHRNSIYTSPDGQRICSGMVKCPFGCSPGDTQPSARRIKKRKAAEAADEARAKRQAVGASAAAAAAAAPYAEAAEDIVDILQSVLYVPRSSLHDHMHKTCPCRPVQCPACPRSIPMHQMQSHMQRKENLAEHFQSLATQLAALKAAPVHPFGPNYQRIFDVVVRVTPDLRTNTTTNSFLFEDLGHHRLESVSVFSENANNMSICPSKDLMVELLLHDLPGGLPDGLPCDFGIQARMCKVAVPGVTKNSSMGADLDIDFTQQQTFPFHRVNMVSGFRKEKWCISSNELLDRIRNDDCYYDAQGRALIYVEIYYLPSSNEQAVAAAAR